jgi:hypothetical protein
MIVATITYVDKRKDTITFTSLADALQKVRSMLDIGDSFVIKENNVLLAKGVMEQFKESIWGKFA